MRPFPLLQRLDPTIRALVLMAAVAPLAVTLSVIAPMWDDAHFLERATCVSQAVFELKNVRYCLSTMAKSPVMAFMLLPAGPLTQGAVQLGVAAFTLACCNFALAAWLGWLTLRARLPLAAVIAAAIGIALCRPIQAAGAPFLVDGAYAIIVTIALFLPVMEMGSPAGPGKPAIWRGVLWGSVFSLGMLAKTSFGMFAALTLPLMIVASLRRSGGCATLQKLLVVALIGLLPALFFVRFVWTYLDLAWQSSFGGGAAFYGDAKPFWQSFSELAATAGIGFWVVCAALLAVAIVHARRDPERFMIALGSIVIVLGYLVLVALSQNQQPRFLWCAWVALPVLIASAIAPLAATETPHARMSLALAGLVAVIASIPMVARFDITPLRQTSALLHSLITNGPVRLVIASDPPFFNINTLQLAQRLDYGKLRGIDLGSVVYDKAEGRSLDYSTEQLLSAQFVVISDPDPENRGPEFTNSLLPRYLEIAQRCGRRVENHPGPKGARLFDMRGTTCPKPGSAPK